jgi:alpha-galactosidase
VTIESRPDDGQFHLHDDTISLVLRVYEDGQLGHLHLGAPLPLGRSYRHLGPDPFPGFDGHVGAPIPMAYPTSGIGDFRVPALVVRGADGTTTAALRYRDHRISAGKPDLPGLPSTYTESDDEAETLELTLADDHVGLEVDVRFTVFRGRPVIARSATLRNVGAATLEVRTAMSLAMDLPDAEWTMLGLTGTWARETHVSERRLTPGRQSAASTRGASSAQHNPYLGLRRATTDEAHGEAYGVSLVYSGDFLAEAEVEPYGTTRVRIGIAPDTCSWQLEPGSSLTTPEAVVAWSDAGLGGVSDAFHGLYRERLARGVWRDRPRPVVLNNWEATYFDFDHDRLIAIATAARDLGVELFVLDDGWFGRRDSDDRSLGDWVVDRRKLPQGVDGIARAVTDLGIAFGIWIEPEMVSPDSDLYRAHPDWVIGIEGRHRTESRQQLVLDFGRPEVVDHLADALGAILSSAPISYVKWDMNRYLTEVGSGALPPARQGETSHRHILGMYELYRRLTTRFPEVLFESCAGGGGRFDPGMLAFAPQAWTSDETDAIERLSIQWGASLVYPLSSISNHVSAVPNHQVGRVTPLSTRAAVAFFGTFGYELDPLHLSDDERAAVVDQIELYRRHREVFQRGRFLRLDPPSGDDPDTAAWMVVGEGARTAVVGHYQLLNRPSPGSTRRVLRGLDPDATYRVTTWPAVDDGIGRANRDTRSGAELMGAGLVLPGERFEAAARGDFWARLFLLEAD